MIHSWLIFILSLLSRDRPDSGVGSILWLNVNNCGHFVPGTGPTLLSFLFVP